MSELVMCNGGEHQPLFIFAHGAGAGMEHAFMEQVALGLAEKGIRVLRFNFPYMVCRGLAGKKSLLIEHRSCSKPTLR